MDINHENLAEFFRGVNKSFRDALKTEMPFAFDSVCTSVNSSSAREDYTWLGEADEMREWVGSRVAKQLASHDYSLKNKTYELTLKAKRTDLEDDVIGIYDTRARLMGEATALWKPRLVADCIAAGAATVCYDGQNFFDTDHPVGKDGDVASVSNNLGGSDHEPIYMCDLSKGIKPFVFQNRYSPDFVSRQDLSDPHVFQFDEFLFGSRARGAAGYTFWQMAMRSAAGGSTTATLIAELREMRTAMKAFENDEGRLLGIQPKHIICGPSMVERVQQVVDSQYLDGALMTPNPIFKQFSVIEVPYLP